MSRRRACPRCKTPIAGYVDQCPSCGLDKPVALPWHVYPIMAAILAAAVWLLLDLDAVGRAIQTFRGGG